MSMKHHHPGPLWLYVNRMLQELNSVFCDSTFCKEIRAPSDCESYVRSVCTECVCGIHLSSVSCASTTSAAIMVASASAIV